jgi:hypothetical protein
MAAIHADTDRTERSKFPELRQKNGVNNYGMWAVKAKYRLIVMPWSGLVWFFPKKI